MPFAFTLPTTSHLTFQAHLLCPTHPSLPSSATSTRSVLRSALKAHKRLPTSQQPAHLRTVHSALLSYLPYLLTIDAALSGRSISNEEVTIALTTDLSVEWRPCLSASTVPGRENPRIKGLGLDYELYSILTTLATLQSLLALDSISRLNSTPLPTPPLRLSHIRAASLSLSTAHSLHACLLTRSNSTDGPPTFPSAATHLSPPIQSALQSYTLAELTLLLILKDDPYPPLLTQSASKSDKEWMIAPPSIPHVRAHLLARLALSASEHAGRAAAALRSEGKVDKDFLEYCTNLQSVSHAKACRFLALDADVSGRTGEGIGWLHAGMQDLGIDIPSDVKSKFARMKLSVSEKREGKLLARASGADAGKAEEGRILVYLEKRWQKMNDTVNTQVVPEWGELVRGMPSGREMPVPGGWTPVVLDEGELARMRAPPEEGVGEGESSGDEEEDGRQRVRGTPGAFPGEGQGGSYY